MLRKSIFLSVIILLSLAVASVALAAAPSTGTVFEGITVPGIAVGDTRSEVEASVGPHRSCSSVEQSADFASCTFDVEDGGQVSVRYRGPDGGNASHSPDDVVTSINWYFVPGWTTTAGINTESALQDRQAVADAYPDAVVTYWNNDPEGLIYSVRDTESGIQVVWYYNFYSGITSVQMSIFKPFITTPPPPPPPSIRVADFEWTANRRGLVVDVLVLDNEGDPAAGALVEATWTYPKVDGLRVSDTTDENGYATFRVHKARRGNYYLQINDLTLDGFVYDRINSQTLDVYSIGR